MRLLIIYLLVFINVQLKAQSDYGKYDQVRDSIMHSLSIEKKLADSLVKDLYVIEQLRLDNLKDTVSSYGQKHEKRLMLSVRKEDALKKWLSADKYKLWHEVYRRRHDPVVLAWRNENNNRL